MKKQILSEELKRMRQLAGLISENHISDYSQEELQKMNPGELSKLDYTSKQFPDLSKKVTELFKARFNDASPIKQAWTVATMETRDKILKVIHDAVAQDKNKWEDDNQFADVLKQAMKQIVGNLNEIMGPMDQKTFERLTSEMTNSIDTYESASRECDAQSGPPGDPHSGAIYNMCMQNVEYPKDKLKNNLSEWKRIDSKFQYMDDNIAQKLMRFFSKSSKEDLANV